MLTYRRPVRFEDIDAAGIVFFARYLNLCHEAMEAFFTSLEGGYAGLITKRHIGLPAVAAKVTYHAPLRYGDVALIDTGVSHIGHTSCTLIYRFRNEQTGKALAEVRHSCVVCVLGDTMQKITIPQDMRALMEAHRTTDPLTKSIA